MAAGTCHVAPPALTHQGTDGVIAHISCAHRATMVQAYCWQSRKNAGQTEAGQAVLVSVVADDAFSPCQESAQGWVLLLAAFPTAEGRRARSIAGQSLTAVLLAFPSLPVLHQNSPLSWLHALQHCLEIPVCQDLSCRSGPLSISCKVATRNLDLISIFWLGSCRRVRQRVCDCSATGRSAKDRAQCAARSARAVSTTFQSRRQYCLSRSPVCSASLILT